MQQLVALYKKINRQSSPISSHACAPETTSFWCRHRAYRANNIVGMMNEVHVGMGQCYVCSFHLYNYDLTSGPLGPRQIINYISWNLLHVTLVEFKAYIHIETLQRIHHCSYPHIMHMSTGTLASDLEERFLNGTETNIVNGTRTSTVNGIKTNGTQTNNVNGT